MISPMPCAQCNGPVRAPPCDLKRGKFKYCKAKCRQRARAGYARKLTLDQVAEIRETYRRYVTPMEDFALRFGVDRRTIFSVVHGRSWV